MNEIMKLFPNLMRGVQEHCSVCSRHLLLVFSSGKVARSLVWELLPATPDSLPC